MWTITKEDLNGRKTVDVTESAQAYQAMEVFFRNWGGSENKVTFDQISNFFYKIYPTFFLEGIQYKSKFYIIDYRDVVEKASSLENHTPSQWTRMRMSSFIRAVNADNGWLLSNQDIADIVVRCAADFSEDYDFFFPYTVRMISKNSSVDTRMRNIFLSAPVQFSVYWAVEVGKEQREVVNDRLTDIELTEPEKTEVNVVLEEEVMVYAHGPEAEPFRQLHNDTMSTQAAAVLELLSDKRAHKRMTIGCTFPHELGGYHRLMISAMFPCTWEAKINEQGKFYQSYFKYKSERISNGRETPEEIMLEWLSHRFRRRNVWG
jgi:hypothetical protein